MKTIFIIILAIVLLGAGFLFFQNSKYLDNPSAPKPSESKKNSTDSKQVAFCTPSQLQGSIDPDGAAGNIYASVTLKNISESSCKVIGNNTLQIGYPSSVTNFQTNVKSQPSTSEFTLSPNQTIYSLIHYPNGPQCSSLATDVNAMVSYNISDAESVTFTPTTGSTLDIPSCENASEITTIDLYPFSETQVTP